MGIRYRLIISSRKLFAPWHSLCSGSRHALACAQLLPPAKTSFPLCQPPIRARTPLVYIVFGRRAIFLLRKLRFSEVLPRSL